MDFTELESIALDMIAIATEANTKRYNFSKADSALMEQSLGEALGVGKCLKVLSDLYPTEMNTITSTV